MKANKALKRLAKVEALLSGVVDRYAAATRVRELLHDAHAAVTRASEAVSLQVSGTAKNPPAKHPPAKPAKPASKKAQPEASEPKRRISEEGMTRIIAATKKRWALKRAEAAKAQGAAKKAAPTGKKAAPTRKKAALAKAAVKAPPAKVAVKAPSKAAKEPVTVKKDLVKAVAAEKAQSSVQAATDAAAR